MITLRMSADYALNGELAVRNNKLHVDTVDC